ncbi:MAG: FliM/FliN family flagellar motor switch protein [Vulcanimicrobiaceae bacterium]
MNVLAFESRAERVGRYRVRSARFQARAHLPLPAATLVANAMREKLVELLRTEVILRLGEPCVPPLQAWPTLLADARMLSVHGSSGDAVLIVRGSDARAWIGATFGGDIASADGLSPLETRVLDRLMVALAGTLAPIVGPRYTTQMICAAGNEQYAAYFELLLQAPLEAGIGVAIPRDPPPPVVGCLQAWALDSVELEVVAELRCREQSAGQLAGLAVGDVLRIDDMTASLKTQGTVLGHGECGISAGRFAVNCTSGSNGL